MDVQKNQVKLTRTQSSLLRSSPTVRSIQSLSSVTEEDVIESENDEWNRKNKMMLRRSRFSSARTCFENPVLVLVMGLVAFFTFFSISCFCLFFYARKEEIVTSENLLMALVLVAIALFLANRNKGLIQQTVSISKQWWEENARRLGISSSNAKPVKWFIGSPNTDLEGKKKKKKKKMQVIREGVEFYSNGDFYEGEFHIGKCNGSGVYNYFANGRYEGDWIDGRYDGYGIESWARGSRYRGQYRHGLRHGFGVYRFYTGDSYAGEWFNGRSHGIGIQTSSDGSGYVGEFKYGAKHGLGCYHFRNGDRYAGEYFGDKVHGFGVYHFANGHCYEGSWHEGQRQGFGMYTFQNVEHRCGEWDAGHLKHPLPSLTDSVLGAVQAARKTAENAVKIGPVDEEANKAVVAANRAANAARVAAVKAVQNRMKGKFCDLES